MRSSGATNFGLFLSVVVLTKSRIACFAGPSFHEGKGSAAAVAAGWPVVEVLVVGFVEQPAKMRIKESNNAERNTARNFILFLLISQRLPAKFCVYVSTPELK